MKQLGILQLPPGWDASPMQVAPPRFENEAKGNSEIAYYHNNGNLGARILGQFQCEPCLGGPDSRYYD